MGGGCPTSKELFPRASYPSYHLINFLKDYNLKRDKSDLSALEHSFCLYTNFLLVLSEMLKIALNYAKKLTNFISRLNMRIYTPIESPYQI